MESDRTLIFVSCPQANEEERKLASNVRKLLESRGYETYIAVESQSLRGIVEGIYPQIEKAEYFLSIDLARDKLEKGDCRGSCFVNQEIAIASFLDKQCMILQQ